VSIIAAVCPARSLPKNDITRFTISHILILSGRELEGEKKKERERGMLAVRSSILFVNIKRGDGK
jgi:hypothetical protein